MWFTVKEVSGSYQVWDCEFNKLIASFEDKYLAEEYMRYKNSAAKANIRPCFN